MEWMDISTAPRDGTWILAYHPLSDGSWDTEHYFCVYWGTYQYNSHKEWIYGPEQGEHGFRDPIYGLTHWQPLPPAPVKEGE